MRRSTRQWSNTRRAVALPPLDRTPRVYCLGMKSTPILRHIEAPRATVYRALLDPVAIATWRVPKGMTSRVHEFDARESGWFRMSLTYDARAGVGKTTARTDTYHGRFVNLVRNKQVVEAIEFETTDPALQGEMTITTTLVDADGGTDVVIEFEGLPRGVLSKSLTARNRAYQPPMLIAAIKWGFDDRRVTMNSRARPSLQSSSAWVMAPLKSS